LLKEKTAKKTPTYAQVNEALDAIEGYMSIKWLDNKRPENLIKAIKGKLRVTETGVAQASYFDVLLDALFGNIVHKYDLNEKLIFEKFEAVVKVCFKKNKLTTPDDILTLLDEYCCQCKRIKHKYTLLTSISIHKDSKFNRLCINDCVLSFYSKPPKKYKNKLDAELKKRNIALDERENYLYVTISVEASDKKSAVDIAFNALDILRSIWQFQFNKSVNILAQDDEIKYWSNSLVITGKYHSLHESTNGGIIEGGLYETNNLGSMDCHKINNLEIFNKNSQLYLKYYKKCSYQDYLKDALTSYISATDTIEFDSRFMKLWSTLEILTKSDNSKEIIKRAIFLYETNIEKSILENLRRARNKHAHAGLLPKNIELKCYQLSCYIEDLLKFMLFNPFKEKSVTKIVDFLSSPKDVVTIDEQIRRLKLAKKFVSSTLS